MITARASAPSALAWLGAGRPRLRRGARSSPATHGCGTRYLRKFALPYWLLLLTLFGWAANPTSVLAASATAEAAPPASSDSDPRVALWPWQWHRQHAVFDSAPGPVAPHPAVARIIVPEEDAIAYGSGTLVDARDQYGLVVTNWHVVRDSKGKVEVVFPSGFRSQARPLKVDKDWDLAALVIWRPPIEPVHISAFPPKPGDLLTIHGYGQGQYRIATGHCTQFFAPKESFPCEMVELDVEARQGDSGGPIFNDRGEIAGVLFGAGEGTTIGSFAPRVQSFLASLAPDIGQAKSQALIAVADRPAPDVHPKIAGELDVTSSNANDKAAGDGKWTKKSNWPSTAWAPDTSASSAANARPTATQSSSDSAAHKLQAGADRFSWSDMSANHWFDRAKSTLAVVGLIAVALQLVRVIR
jgi:serine protease Do